MTQLAAPGGFGQALKWTVTSVATRTAPEKTRSPEGQLLLKLGY